MLSLIRSAAVGSCGASAPVPTLNHVAALVFIPDAGGWCGDSTSHAQGARAATGLYLAKMLINPPICSQSAPRGQSVVYESIPVTSIGSVVRTCRSHNTSRRRRSRKLLIGGETLVQRHGRPDRRTRGLVENRGDARPDDDGVRQRFNPVEPVRLEPIPIADPASTFMNVV